jgi:hypothetical protein
MSFLSTLAEFGGSWEETSRESLDKNELKEIKSIEVVERTSKGGNGSTAGEKFLCMVFFMKSGKTKSAYLSKMSDLEAGDKVDPKSVEFITLERDGEETVKADGTAL